MISACHEAFNHREAKHIENIALALKNKMQAYILYSVHPRSLDTFCIITYYNDIGREFLDIQKQRQSAHRSEVIDK